MTNEQQNGFWYHRKNGFSPYIKGVYEEKHHPDAIFVSEEYHRYLFNHSGAGYYIKHPEEDGVFPVLEKVSIDYDLARKELIKEMRAERNSLLKQSDWTQLPDVPENTAIKYKEYRQLLRDIPHQSGFPFEIEWPKHPEEST